MVGQTIDAMYIGFRSDAIAPNQVTDYLIRVVQPKLQAVEGVQTAEMLGSKTFAMRAWLDPIRLAAYGVTASEVSTALTNNDYIASLGNTKGADGSGEPHRLHQPAQCGRVQEPHRQAGQRRHRAAEGRGQCHARLGRLRFRHHVQRQSVVYVGIQIAPSANLLVVIKGVRAALPEIERQPAERPHHGRDL